jgi:hypothetical protein
MLAELFKFQGLTEGDAKGWRHSHMSYLARTPNASRCGGYGGVPRHINQKYAVSFPEQ